MSITIDFDQNLCRIRARGELSMTCVAELKEGLMQAFGSGREIDVDLAAVEEIDITAIQVLWAAARDANRDGRVLEGRFSPLALQVLRDIGFEPFLPARTAEPQAGALEPQASRVESQAYRVESQE